MASNLMCSVMLLSENTSMPFSKMVRDKVRVRNPKVTFYIHTFFFLNQVSLAMKQDSHLVASRVTACLLNSTNVNTAWEKNDPCLQGSFQNNLATKKKSQKVERENLKWTHSSYKDFPIYLLSLFKGFYHSFWKLILEINYFLFELTHLEALASNLLFYNFSNNSYKFSLLN